MKKIKLFLKRLFCSHKEEDMVQTVYMPYGYRQWCYECKNGYNKSCFKCRKCGRERWDLTW